MAEALGNEKAVGRDTQGVRDDKCPVSPGFVMRETKLLLALLSYGKVGYQRHGEIIRGSATLQQAMQARADETQKQCSKNCVILAWTCISRTQIQRRCVSRKVTDRPHRCLIHVY